jgi:hypothetical protein
MRMIFLISRAALLRVASPAAVLAILLFAFGPRTAGAAQLHAGFTYVTVSGDTALRSDASGRLKVVLWYPSPPQRQSGRSFSGLRMRRIFQKA